MIRIARSRIRQAVVGLAIASLLLQVLLSSVHASLMAAPNPDMALLGANVICTEHGTVILPEQDKPSDPQSPCLLCPVCWSGSGAASGILPVTAVLAILVHGTPLRLESRRRSVNPVFSNLPPSRAPPAFA